MDSFRWLSVAFSMILGLGVTRVLSGTILVFRSRHRALLDWIPLVWAGAIFVLQLQFWWALIELAGVDRVWTRGEFLALVAIPLLLFAAAALVLPHDELEAGERLRDVFERDGRFGLLCLSGYAALAAFVDWKLFGLRGFSSADAYLAGEFVLPILCLFSRSRRFEAGTSLAYLALVFWSSWRLSPAAY